MANPDKKSQEHTQKTNSNPLQEPWKEIGMTEQDYKAMMSSDNHARHAEANSSKNKPWEQVGMTEQDYKAMMSDNNPRTQTVSTYQNQPTRHTTNNSPQKDWEKIGMTEQDYKAMMSDSNPRTQTASTYQTQSVKPTTTQVKNDITNIKNPTYLYNEDDIKNIRSKYR
ncbi:hypothetical protein [Rickettsia endosymbiont of Rhinocyllus conicus]|uniref:hypothetical protein n=1 Tax=Rickettsia endosymbiont of Rhinocyllus conicus TaxID=3066252 RepID=UPI003132BFE6